MVTPIVSSIMLSLTGKFGGKWDLVALGSFWSIFGGVAYMAHVMLVEVMDVSRKARGYSLPLCACLLAAIPAMAGFASSVGSR